MSDPLESGSDLALSTLDFLSGSPNRVEILRLLREAGPATRRDVRESVDASRSTVRRTLEGFLERDWIASTNDGYRVTAAGGLVLEEFLQLSETVRVTDEYAPLLAHLPDSALDVDPEWFDDAVLTASSSADPYAPAQRQTETLREADRFSGLLPSIELEGTKLVHDRITTGEFRAAIVLSQATAERVREAPFAELFCEKLATGRLEVYAHDGELPFYLGLLDDDDVEVGCENDDGIPQALLESSNAEFRAWGERTFERYVEAAERLTEADF